MTESLNIKLKNVFLKLQNIQIFKNLNFDFSSNGVSIILGANGSGKTLLTKAIVGLIELDKGEVIKNKTHEIGYAPQKIVFLRRNVYENLAYPLKVKGENGQKIKKKINKLMEEFGVEKKKFLSARNLSAGNSQYISFIRSIVADPKMLILDEPCSNLDDNFRIKVEDYIRKYKKKKKIIMITHDFLQAKRLADEIIIMRKGNFIGKYDKKYFIKNEKEVIKKFFSN
ncbi:MAG: hypothetical protein CMP43_00560 [Rickettsiales bacterium]|nr:hypothetical protein [Rickettsiales bacterium]